MRGAWQIVLVATVALLDAHVAWALQCGETVGGSIAVPGLHAEHSFVASPGDAIVLSVTAAGGSPIEPVLELFAPSTVQVPLNGALAPCGAVCSSAALLEVGTYTIRVSDQGQDESGAFDLTLEAVSGTFTGIPNGPPNPSCQLGLDGTQPLQCGDRLARTIDPAGESDSFTFDALAGDEVSLVARPLAGSAIEPLLRLHGPDGVRLPLNGAVGVGVWCAGPCRSDALPANGVYTVLLWDDAQDDAGDYELWMCGNMAACGPDSDGDGLGACDPCLSFANSDLTDSNGDGIPNECQCGDTLPYNGILQAADAFNIVACVTHPGTCVEDIEISEANHNHLFAAGDAFAVASQVISNSATAYSLTCARRPEGTEP